jgi:hypothetical protein
MLGAAARSCPLVRHAHAQCNTTVFSGAVRINEVLSRNKGGLEVPASTQLNASADDQQEAPQHPAWLELLNTGTQPAQLQVCGGGNPGALQLGRVLQRHAQVQS